MTISTRRGLASRPSTFQTTPGGVGPMQVSTTGAPSKDGGLSF
jgi:hypothetical protein